MIGNALIDGGDHVIQGMWVGADLSAMEQLSIRSFLANGHDFHLYTYGSVGGIPVGTTVCDASEVLPSSAIFRYKENGSYAGFSNFFRYELLLKRGGWWVDLDTVCLRPFRFDADYVIGTEPVPGGAPHPISGVMKAPAGCDLMKFLTQVCREKDTADIRWGQTGPRLVAKGVLAHSLESFIQPSDVFCPLGYREWEKLLEPNPDISFSADVFAVHLWNEMWRRSDKNKDSDYAPGSIYEQLKTTYPMREAHSNGAVGG